MYFVGALRRGTAHVGESRASHFLPLYCASLYANGFSLAQSAANRRGLNLLPKHDILRQLAEKIELKHQGQNLTRAFRQCEFGGNRGQEEPEEGRRSMEGRQRRSCRCVLLRFDGVNRCLSLPHAPHVSLSQTTRTARASLTGPDCGR